MHKLKKKCVAVIQMVWNGRVSAHDFYETTRIFFEKDDFPISNTGDSQKKKIPVFQKANLDGIIFAYDYCAQLACVMTSPQVVSCKLDPQHSYNTLWRSCGWSKVMTYAICA